MPVSSQVKEALRVLRFLGFIIAVLTMIGVGALFLAVKVTERVLPDQSAAIPISVTQPPVLKPQPPRRLVVALREATYSISQRKITLPDGRTLEAHSGMGRYRDNPSPAATRVKNRGSTPPNLYRVSFRGGRFHGVRALALDPVDNEAMHGRDGILVHTPMLRGEDNASNGCIVLRQYATLLEAFERGEFKFINVVR